MKRGLLIVEQAVLIDMDIRSYIGSSSKPSTLVPFSSSSNHSSSEEEIEAPPTKKPCVSKPKLLKKRLKYRTTSSSSRKYKKGGKKTFRGCSMMLIVRVHSVNFVTHLDSHLSEQVECGQPSHSPTFFFFSLLFFDGWSKSIQ